MNSRESGRASVQAPCKINPTLVVKARRQDGFHELELSYLALELSDRLELTAITGRAGELRVAGPMASEDIPHDERNLVRRAARAALNVARAEGLATIGDDVDIALTKLVPSQAGLGGGSSDAAAAILGVCALTGLSAADSRLSKALAELGSDCNFFLAARESGHAMGRGRGDRIETVPAPSPSLWIVLLTPRIHASTEAVYRALGELGDPSARSLRAARAGPAWSQATTLDSLRAALVNDLEAAALRALPELASWRALLDAHGSAHFRLAGSGSSFFGLFTNESDARKELTTLRNAATAQGLVLRGGWLTRPASHGVKMMD